MRATIKDVAKLADVSTATVSNVLNDRKNVSDLLKERVYEAIEELNYQPNTIARSLKTNRSYSLGVIVPDILNPFFAEALKSIQHVASKKDYQVLVYDSAEDANREEQLINLLINAGVDGIINITSRMKEDDLQEGLAVPLVMADRHSFATKGNISFVCADNFASGNLAAKHLLTGKYDNYVCIAGPVDSTTVAYNRLEGFKDVLTKEGIPEQNLIIRKCNYNFAEGYATMIKLLDEMDESETYGIYVSSDIMAWGAIEACKSRDIMIPQKIGIIGNDNIWCSEYIVGGLSTVENSAHELGVCSTKILLDAVENNGKFLCHEKILKPQLCIRKTTK